MKSQAMRNLGKERRKSNTPQSQERVKSQITNSTLK